jgi:hypothetical protein
MNVYVIIVYLLNANTGDVEQTYVSSKPMTAEACLTALSERGPVPVKDGLAQFAVCQKAEDKAGDKVST